MSLQLTKLDLRTRQFMLAEMEQDVWQGKLYISSRLSPNGQKDYEGLLRAAIETYDAMWLARNLRSNGRMNSTEQRGKPNGGFTTAKIPENAPETLAEGEFNRFYIRGLCRQAIEDDIRELVVYRAKAVSCPRAESEAKIGTRIEVATLLDDLRNHIGIDTALGLPAGPNSGLSVRLP